MLIDYKKEHLPSVYKIISGKYFEVFNIVLKRLIRPTAVSYTHLDVYKRQILCDVNKIHVLNDLNTLLEII